MAPSYLNLIINGQLVSEVILHQVAVTQELNRHWWCHAHCRHLEDQRFPGAGGGSSQSPTIRVESWLGKDLQVVAFEEGNQQTIFDGFVLEVELQYELSGAYGTLIRGVTRSYKMDVTPRHAYYAGKTLNDVVQQLTGNAGLSASVNCANRDPLNYVQWGETDFHFLHRLVDDHGGWFRPTAKGIEIYDSFQKGATVKWQQASQKDALLDFSLKGTLAPAGLDGAHYHFHQMKSQTYKNVSEDPAFFGSAGYMVEAAKAACKTALPSGYLQHRGRAVTLDDYEKLLKKESARSSGSTVVGSGQTQNRDLLPGNTVRVEGTHDADGEYGVTRVSHNWEPTGYSNQMGCTPWKNYTDPNPPEPPPLYGLVPARVVGHNDPKKMGRVQVQYFWQEDSTANWARMMTPHAGSDRGFMFMPEEGDEVVVAFEDGDIERPIVLGCVWNGVDQAPRQEFWGGELDNNDVKRIVTKSGHRVQFVDKKGKESIVIATPTHLKLSLIESTDETGRSMLTLHSDDGDIFLSAPNGRIHLHSKFFSREVG